MVLGFAEFEITDVAPVFITGGGAGTPTNWAAARGARRHLGRGRAQELVGGDHGGEGLVDVRAAGRVGRHGRLDEERLGLAEAQGSGRGTGEELDQITGIRGGLEGPRDRRTATGDGGTGQDRRGLIVIAAVAELDLEPGVGEERIGQDRVARPAVHLHSVVAVVGDGVAFDQVARGGGAGDRDPVAGVARDHVPFGRRRSADRVPGPGDQDSNTVGRTMEPVGSSPMVLPRI